jgi:hypothetical protein
MCGAIPIPSLFFSPVGATSRPYGAEEGAGVVFLHIFRSYGATHLFVFNTIKRT